MKYMTSTSDIGIRIKKCRKASGLTQAEVAERMDLSVNYVSDLENGKKNMSMLTIANLCQCFNKSADYFLFGKEDIASKINLDNVIEYVSTLSVQQLENMQTYIESLLQLKGSKKS